MISQLTLALRIFLLGLIYIALVACVVLRIHATEIIWQDLSWLDRLLFLFPSLSYFLFLALTVAWLSRYCLKRRTWLYIIATVYFLIWLAFEAFVQSTIRGMGDGISVFGFWYLLTQFFNFPVSFLTFLTFYCLLFPFTLFVFLFFLSKEYVVSAY